MNFKTWCAAAPGRQALLAERLNVSASAVSQVVNDGRRVPPGWYRVIVKLSKGEVSFDDLVPKTIWPELADDCKHEEMTGNTCDVCGETMPDFVGP